MTKTKAFFVTAGIFVAVPMAFAITAVVYIFAQAHPYISGSIGAVALFGLLWWLLSTADDYL